jgi:hypothetical protein
MEFNLYGFPDDAVHNHQLHVVFASPENRIVCPSISYSDDKQKTLRNNLQNLGFNTGNLVTHIIPIILGDENIVMSAKEKLLK